MVSLDLGANVGRSGTLGARLSRKTDLAPGIQPIKIDRAAAIEEVVVAVFGGDKPESALGDELLDGSRHLVWTSFPERTASRCRGLFERGPRRAHPRRVHCQATQGPKGSNPHPTLPRKRRRKNGYGKGLTTIMNTMTRAITPLTMP